MDYDAVLVVSFGGPEAPDDVLPFLRNVTRGRGVPAQRLVEVARHYERFGGRSPLNDQNRALVAALTAELTSHGHDLAVYWGNRNWHPYLGDTVGAMAADGVRRALAFVTSAFSSYSSCRQYLDDLERARAEVGPEAPIIDKIRTFHDHPGFVATQAKLVNAALSELPADVAAATRVAFSAHSIPAANAATCDYVAQLRESAGLVAARFERSQAWDIVYQSRSGPPQVPWLEPDMLDHIDRVAAEGVRGLVIAPLGFLSDHLEVVYDLDVMALDRAAGHGIVARRAPTVGIHPDFVATVRLLVEERLDRSRPRLALGAHPPRPDRCPPACCPAATQPTRSPHDRQT